MKTLLEARISKRESTEDIGKVDVVVLTKNSEEQLERCLSAIYQNVPLNRLILVDGYSTDRTLDIVSEFEKKYHNVVLIQDNGWRGKARQIGINKVNTKWFMFVDSDAELCKRWFEKAKSFITPDVGAVWGIEIWPGIQNPEILNLFLKITRKIFELRGGTHDLLLRYDAIVGIAIPDNLHVFEDAFIKEWIAKKGYKVIPTYDPYCIHYRPQAVWTTKGSLDLIIETLRFASIRKIPSYIVAYGFYAAYVTHRIISGKKLSLSHLSD
jgi:glycosyltransferase involved in cell wall biosynthesis